MKLAKGIIICLILALFMGGSFAEPIDDDLKNDEGYDLKLSEEEQRWLQAHPVIRVGSDPSWDPVEFQDNHGEYVGISQDFLEIMEESLDVQFEIAKDLSWAEIIRRVENKEIDMLSAAIQTPSREEYLEFTQPYMNLFTVIFTRESSSFITDLNDLKQKQVATVKGYAIAEFLKRDFPDLTLLEVVNVDEGLKFLSEGRIDAYVDTLLTTSHIIEHKGYSNIKVAGSTPYNSEIHMAVREDWTLFQGILDKAINAMSEEQRNGIFRKWRSLQIDERYDYNVLLETLTPIFLIIIILIAWAFQLKRELGKRRRIEIELSYAKEVAEQANSAKSLFLAHMSHEIRTPLNAVLGYAQILQRDNDLTDDHLERVNRINRSGQHLLSLINDVLDMSKIEAGKIRISPVSFSLNNLIGDLHIMFDNDLKQKNLDFEIIMDSGLPDVIYADESRIRQVVINLLSNAIKFTEIGDILLQATKKGDLIEIIVKDTGVGIPLNRRESIFEAFEQVKNGDRTTEGTGLGLAISKKMARLMDGDLTVESIVGKGSTFYFTFAYEQGNEYELNENIPENVVRHLKPGQKDISILIVDDKEDNRSIARFMLEPIGFNIYEAENGQVAVDMFKDLRPQVILMDIVMPIMDGKEAIKIIRKLSHGKKVTIITVGTSAFEGEREEILALGADVFLKKPYRDTELLEIIMHHAGVEYVYVDHTPIERATEAIQIDPKSIKDLSQNQIDDFKRAIKIGDMDQLVDMADTVSKMDPELADALKRLVDNYDLERIAKLFELEE